MDLYFQCGHGMKSIMIELAQRWGCATAILSPRDIKPIQLEKWSKEFKEASISLLFDPQYYYYDIKNLHKGLSEYDYFKKKLSKKEIMSKIKKYNDLIKTDSFIIPSHMDDFSDEWVDNWFKESKEWIKEANEVEKEKNKIYTLAIPNELLLQKEDVIEEFIEKMSNLDIDSFYIIPYPNKEKYLCDTPMWFSNLMQICASIKLQNKKVIVGYSNYQHLFLSICKVDAIASGTFINVRKFSKEKFTNNKDVKLRNVWYYHPQSLSEYKIGFLDLAYNAGVINNLKPKDNMQNDYSNILFNGQLPSSVNYTETDSFKHYLCCLKAQATSLTYPSFDETSDALTLMISNAQTLIDSFRNVGVFNNERSFDAIVDTCNAAIIRLTKIRGFQLKQEWDSIE